MNQLSTYGILNHHHGCPKTEVLHSQLHPRKERIIHFTWPLVIALLFHMCKWDLLKSTNSTNFSKFIRILGEHLIENLEVKPHIMYDGHRSH